MLSDKNCKKKKNEKKYTVYCNPTPLTDAKVEGIQNGHAGERRVRHDSEKKVGKYGQKRVHDQPSPRGRARRVCSGRRLFWWGGVERFVQAAIVLRQKM